jgi:hypothetical protein
MVMSRRLTEPAPSPHTASADARHELERQVYDLALTRR